MRQSISFANLNTAGEGTGQDRKRGRAAWSLLPPLLLLRKKDESPNPSVRDPGPKWVRSPSPLLPAPKPSSPLPPSPLFFLGNYPGKKEIEIQSPGQYDEVPL